MIFPKGKPVYENLNTSFTRFDDLLSKLTADGFTGYVRVVFWGYEGTLLINQGKVINAVEESQDARKIGGSAATSVVAKAQDKDGAVSIYALDEEMIARLSSVVDSEPLHKGLSSEFTSLDRLIAKLKNEHHSGYIEISLNDNNGTGMVFLHSGDLVETIFSTNGMLTSGSIALPKLIETASAGAMFNVFRAVAKPSGNGSGPGASLAFPQILAIWQEILAAVEGAGDSVYGKGHFVNAFKDTLNEKAEAFPFLDPFAAEFDYANGGIKYDGDPEPNLNVGLAECLHITMGRLASDKHGAEFSARALSALGAVREKHSAALQETGIGALVPELQ